MAKSRLASAPEIPTADEAGLPGFSDSQWFAVFAPKGTPKNVIAKLNAAVVDALAAPGVRQRFADIEHEIPQREAADAGSARCAAEGRNREVVAYHQGGKHQGGMNFLHCIIGHQSWAGLGHSRRFALRGSRQQHSYKRTSRIVILRRHGP